MTNDIKTVMGGLCGSLISFFGASMNVGDIESIVSIICGVLGLIITIISAVVIPVWKKIRDAKEDGKITPEEAEDIVNTLQDGIDKINKDKEDK